MKKSLFILAFAAAAFTGCKDTASAPADAPKETATADANAPAKMETASFTIDGMTCAMGCAKTIENKLSHLDGVKKAEVDFDAKKATVEFDANKQTPESLAKAVEGVGGGDMYKVSNVHSSGDHAALFIKEKDKDKKKKDKNKKSKKECSKDDKPGCCKGKASCHGEGKM